MARITFEDILRMESPFITATQAEQAMKMQSGRLGQYARERPDRINFRYQMSGKNMKIPRIPFLKFWGITDEQIEKKSLR